jgi:hypothetical protein
MRLFRPPDGSAVLPSPWYAYPVPRCVDVALPPSAVEGSGGDSLEDVRGFLGGVSDAFLARVQRATDEVWGQVPVDGSMAQLDVETLRTFWRTGPYRQRTLRDRFGLGGTWIEREELDDLLVMHAAEEGRAERGAPALETLSGIGGLTSGSIGNGVAAVGSGGE